MRGSSAPTSDTNTRDQRKQYHIFVSHAGEQKKQLVDHVRDKFAKAYPQLVVFADEWTLLPGDRAMDELWGACEAAHVGKIPRSPSRGAAGSPGSIAVLLTPCQPASHPS
jgi:hypothetical protein